ncbi:MAG TPA: type I 3-dehydroquinate dehydratase, partial [Vicinamibacteria bacterium]|nr:type I 3-dehydroquinate dehydratase [Vicinamibacteria bacterium]
DLDALRELGRELGKPLLLTCRSAREGGAFRGTEGERLAILARAIDRGFEYVDVEIDALEAALPKRSGTRLVLSHHDFEAFPAGLDRTVAKALALGADVVKIAARVSSLAGSIRLARAGEEVRKAGKEYVPVPLGPAGTSGRILASRLGAAFTYAPLAASRTTGPGQVPLDELLDLFRFRSISGNTAVYGIVGERALETLSPAMHNRLFARLGRDAVYVPFQETDLPAFVSAARELGVTGLSVTIPFKEAILEHLDEVDELASRIGAVNTVVVRNGRWKGYNTDRDGVLEPLRKFGSLRGKRAVLVGAGGASRAAAHALVEDKASVLVLARNEARASSLAASLGCSSGSLALLPTTSWDLLVNATPASPGVDSIPAESIVFDMVTVPEETALIRKARESGASTITGLEMLAAQAVPQARLWLDVQPEASELLGYARSELARRVRRYSRQILFPGIGAAGQERIRRSSVLVVGAGALGSIAAEVLVRAGVARLRLVDRDYVDESNLQRQSLYDEHDLAEGLPKAVAAQRKLSAINGEVGIEAKVEDVHAGNVLGLLDGMDLLLDGTDNFETRYLLNDASIRTGIPWIYAACVGSYGMSFVVRPGATPCLRCLLEEEPPPGTSPTCDTAGVIAPAVHAVSAFQLAEALKILSGRTEALTGAVLSLDVWEGKSDSFRPGRKRDDCPACALGKLEYLAGAAESQTLTLCGRNAVQVRPARPAALALEGVAARLRESGEATDVIVNAYLLRGKLAGREIVLFPDGRAIVQGTEDPAEARSLYARYVGM